MEDFNSLESSIKAALVSTVRMANALGTEDISFHRSLDTSVGTTLDRQNARLLGLADRLVSAATANTEIVRPPRLSDLDSLEGNWKTVVDVVDSLLERTDTALDEFTGAVKRLSPGVDQTPASKPPRTSKIAAALKTQDLPKPQLHFEHVPKNDEKLPFKPLLKSKPHASVPLQTSPVASDDESQQAYPHPYQLEIQQYRYPASVYVQSEPIVYRPFESTTATLVDTEDALADMLEELKQAKEVAIDLEHHDNRSYIGIVSLMQISTRDKDWIVDTLRPWRRRLQCLNEVFTDPNILKILHGAYMDVVWLQRDLGLYLVGLFDTHYAARALGYPGGSLAYLLKRFIDFDAQKQYQMADWRIRPLPQELFDYARSDTHFLLYIFDNLRNELIQKSDFSKPNHEGDKIWDVLSKSADCALQRYEHPIYDAELGQGPMGWYKLLSRTPALFTKEQFSVFRAVHKWRDDVAREQDDSVHYIMPNHHIFSIAKAMPTTRSALIGVAQPFTQTERLRADELLSAIARAKAMGNDGPDMIELMNQVEPEGSKRLAAAQTKAAAAVADEIKPETALLTSGPDSSIPIRSSKSAFWGGAFESSAWHQKRAVSSIALSVPLPSLTAEIFADPSDTVLANAEPDESQPSTAEVKDEDESDVFVLQDLRSKKRKRVDPMDGMAANSDEVVLPDSEAARSQDRAEKKAAKRAARKAARGASANGMLEGGDAADEEPFDYASAPSILNPPREGRATMKERKKREKQMNPYAKALDTAKGLPRSQKEKAGKSMTYKS